MPNKINKYALLLLSVGLIVSTPSQGVNKVGVIAPESRIVHPGDTLHIPLPSNTTDLLFELDNIDVTDLVNIQNGIALITPAELLNIGSHQVVVYRLSGDNLETISTLTYQVETGGAPTTLADTDNNTGQAITTDGESNSGNYTTTREAKNSNISIHGSFEASRIIAQSANRSSSGNDWQLTSNAQLQGQWGRGDWSVEANTNVLLEPKSITDGTTGSSNRYRLNIGDFLIKLKKGNLSSQIGNHQLDSSNLLLYNFYRRGISVNWKLPKKNIDLTGFSYNAQTLSGFEGGLGISDSNNRITGGILKLTPFKNVAKATDIIFTWLTGKQQNPATTTDNNTTTQSPIISGNAWDIAVNSKLFDDKLSIKTEVAQSLYDDGDNTTAGEASHNDRAYIFDATYQILTPDYQNKHTKTLEIGLEKKRIGTYFRSLANNSLTYDLDSTRLHTLFNNGQLTLQGGVEYQKNNVNDIENIPTLGTTLADLNINYTPLYEGDKKPGFWGKPSFGANITQSAQETIKQPASFTTEVDQVTFNSTIFANFYYDKWDWSTSLTQGFNDDRTKDERNTNQLLSIGFNVRPYERLDFNSYWQISRQNNQNSDDTSQQSLSFNMNAEIIPSKLNANAGINISEQRTEGSLQSRTSSLDFGVNWTPDAQKTRRTHLSYWLRGQYSHQSGINIGTDQKDDYEVSAGLSVNF